MADPYSGCRMPRWRSCKYAVRCGPLSVLMDRNKMWLMVTGEEVIHVRAGPVDISREGRAE